MDFKIEPYQQATITKIIHCSTILPLPPILNFSGDEEECLEDDDVLDVFLLEKDLGFRGGSFGFFFSGLELESDDCFLLTFSGLELDEGETCLLPAFLTVAGDLLIKYIRYGFDEFLKHLFYFDVSI